MRRSGSSERHMHMHGRQSGPREQAAPAFVDILFDADEERNRRGWQSIAVPVSACVADLRRMVFDTVPTCGVETDAHLVLQTEDGARLYAAMSLAEAGLDPGSRIVWRSGRADGLRKLLEPEAPTELHGHAKRQKTFALEMKFGGRPPIDPYSRELELVAVELPGEAAGSLHGIEGQAARAAAQKAARNMGGKITGWGKKKFILPSPEKEKNPKEMTKAELLAFVEKLQAKIQELTPKDDDEDEEGSGDDAPAEEHKDT